MHDFRKLDVYQRALFFTKRVRGITASFPREELYGLMSQFRRAADSIVQNLAEGAGCASKKEFARFIGYSARSGYECGGCADIASILEYISKKDYDELIDETNQIVAMMIGLQRSWQRRQPLQELPTTYYLILSTLYST
jgi:four helix bundle protein